MSQLAAAELEIMTQPTEQVKAGRVAVSTTSVVMLTQLLRVVRCCWMNELASTITLQHGKEEH
jgi:hypothetical protein